MIDSAAEGCGPVSCAGYAIADALWKVLGAESVSQVADKGAGASTGDKVMAAITFVTLGKGEVAVAAAKGVGEVAEDAAKGALAAGKKFSSEKQALVEMAKGDKKTGMTAGDMQAYKDLNKELPDPFPTNKVRGPEAHPSGGSHSQEMHGHVDPVNHIPIKPPPPAPPPKDLP